MKKADDYSRPSRFTRYLQRSGFVNKRNLLWSFYEPRNFGDWIGPYLFEAVTGKVPFHYSPRLGGLSSGFSAAGSIMRHLTRKNRIDVWGSGIISLEDKFDKPKNVFAVRGPQTRDHLARLGYQTSDIYGDPGILMPLFYKPDIEKKFRVGIIPHFIDFESMGSAFSEMEDVHVIDVCRDVETVIDDILSCEVTVSSSLHGVILSHSYGISCAWISPWGKLDGDGTKFRDYFESTGTRTPKPQEIRPELGVTQLVTISDSSPKPDVFKLQMPLMKACPFSESAP